MSLRSISEEILKQYGVPFSGDIDCIAKKSGLTEEEILNRLSPLGKKLEMKIGEAISFEGSRRDYGTIFWDGEKFLLPEFEEGFALPPKKFVCPTGFPPKAFSFLHSEFVWFDWEKFKEEIENSKYPATYESGTAQGWEVASFEYQGRKYRILLPEGFSSEEKLVLASISEWFSNEVMIDNIDFTIM